MGVKEKRCGLEQAGIVYLMRGLPSSGKSHTARCLAGDTGVVCETDAFFHRPDVEAPGGSVGRGEGMEQARQRNFECFARALDAGASPVIVDRGNGLSPETARYAALALERGYQVQLREPASPWWQEIRVLLKYRDLTEPVLRIWAERLAELSLSSHGIPAEAIWSQICAWRHGLGVDDILRLAEEGPAGIDLAAGGAIEARPQVSPREAPDAVHSVRPTGQQETAQGRPPDRDWLREFLIDDPGSGS